MKDKLQIPLILISLLSLWTIVFFIIDSIQSQNTHYHHLISWNQYLTLLFLLINWIIFIRHRRYYKYMLIITIILGLLNILNFIPYTSYHLLSVGYGDNALTVKFQPVFLIIALITFLLKLKPIIRHIQSKLELNEREKQKIKNDEVRKFKEQYADYSDSLLQQIIADDRYTAAATEAAQQLLEERNRKS